MAAAPTVAMSQGDHAASNGGSSAPSTSSLFNSDEAKFMNDSFSSAESFDPFTVGAPGFKVPNVLPANLGGMGSAPGTTAKPDESNGSNGQALASLNDAGLGAGNLGTASRGGYGQDKSWQLQQLEALQAERFRYASSKQDPNTSSQPQHPHRHSLAGPSVLPDTSMIGHSLYRDNASGWGPYDPSIHSQQQHNAMSEHYSSNFVINQQMRSSQSGDLSALGAHFPSSHQFPGGGNHSSMLQHNNRPASFPYFSNQNQIAEHMRNHFDPNNAGAVQGGMDQEMMGGEMNRNKKIAQKGRQNQQAIPGQQQMQQHPLESDLSYTFTPAPRPPMPVVDVDKIAQSNVIPSELEEEFFSNSLKRLQPHLIELRKEQMRRKAQGLSANIRKDRKEAKQAARGGAEDEDSTNENGNSSGKKKQTQVLLTEAEKKANHIASEQKRRANIRKGYELLCSLVPSLSEGMDGAGDEGENDGDDDDDEGDEEDDDDEIGQEDGENKRRGKKRRAMGEGANANANERNENKSGPRSEAIILMKAVDHIRSKIDEHYFLVKRKQDIQTDLARRFGADSSCFLD